MALGLFSSGVDSAQSSWGSSCDAIPLKRTRLFGRSLDRRILLLALLFGAEFIIRLAWLNGYPGVRLAGLMGAIHGWNHWIYRCMVVFGATFVTFAYLKYKTALERISAQVEQIPIRWSFLAGHCLAMGVFAGLSTLLYGGAGAGSWANLLEASWFMAGISAIAFAGFAFLSWGVWAQLIRSTGYLWAYASIAAVSAYVVGNMFQRLWQPASYLTLRLTEIFLNPFVSGIITNPATMVIGTQSFQVQIGPACSGLEGVGLILAFVILWLLIFRQECNSRDLSSSFP